MKPYKQATSRNLCTATKEETPRKTGEVAWVPCGPRKCFGMQQCVRSWSPDYGLTASQYCKFREARIFGLILIIVRTAHNGDTRPNLFVRVSLQCRCDLRIETSRQLHVLG